MLPGAPQGGRQVAAGLLERGGAGGLGQWFPGVISASHQVYPPRLLFVNSLLKPSTTVEGNPDHALDPAPRTLYASTLIIAHRLDRGPGLIITLCGWRN